ncbi:NADH-quinone oxidoreductase subunit N [Paraglaciecola polaris]|uniref:NADH-quinone oxidoreductase subunit N n=1 Tax=Paraglaciecola polaris TaxID=222814 RepID=UPI0030ECC524|tara:strand:- start:2491 stop:3924 length:1434 start_codon:yes stop_codon:yes gene_type:complete
MSLQELWLLLPVLIICVGVLTLMLQAAWQRNNVLAQGLTVLTLTLALGALICQYPTDMRTITLLFEHEPIGGFFSLLLLMVAISVALLQGPYMGKNSKEVAEEFYILLLLSCLGGILLVMSRHVASVILSIELMSLSMLAMLAYNRERKLALEGAMKYLLLSGAATSLLLLGFALLYATSGQLLLTQMLSSPMQLVAKSGFVLVVAGLAFKLSLVPLHFWTPDVYQGAPVNSTLLLTSLSKAAVFALFIKLILLIPPEFEADMVRMLSWMAIASMLLGNWLALQQRSLKRLMAYSAIAHMGYVLVAGVIAMGIDHSLVLEGASYYLLAYLVASILIFAVLTLLSKLDEQQDLDDLPQLQGLFWQHPWLASVMTLAFLSLAGMPITIGFIGKFYLLTLAVKLSAWWLVTAMLVGSAVGLYYYLRVIFTLFAPLQRDIQQTSGAYLSKMWIGVITAGLLLLGILPGLLGDELRRILAIG